MIINSTIEKLISRFGFDVVLDKFKEIVYNKNAELGDVVQNLTQICYDEKKEDLFQTISTIRKGVVKENNNPDVII
jgi:hypothetical protein